MHFTKAPDQGDERGQKSSPPSDHLLSHLAWSKEFQPKEGMPFGNWSTRPRGGSSFDSPVQKWHLFVTHLKNHRCQLWPWTPHTCSLPPPGHAHSTVGRTRLLSTAVPRSSPSLLLSLSLHPYFQL